MSGPTQALLDSAIARLKAQIPELGVDYFPDDPDAYRVNHPFGMLLVSYAGGHFGETKDTGVVVQERVIRLTVTTIMRQLNGRMGAVEALDRVRLALVGFKPAHCLRNARALEEKFLARKDGLWYYATAFETASLQIEDAADDSGPVATRIIYEDIDNVERVRVPRAG